MWDNLKPMTIRILSSVVILAALASCTSNKEVSYREAFDPSTLDSSYSPTNDFFRFVNAKWIAENPIPGDRSRYATFDKLNEQALNTLKDVMEKASTSNAAKGSNEQKVGDFYFSGMDSASINAQGASALQPYFDMINGMSGPEDFAATSAWMNRIFTGVPFVTWVGQDDKNSAEQVLNFWQGGLGLPDRDDYFRDDAQSAENRAAYKQHIVNTLVLMGRDEAMAEKEARSIYAMEEKLAGASMDRVTMRDPHATYHKMSLADLSAMCPNMDWNTFFSKLGTPSMDSVLVSQPDFMTALNGMIKSVPMDDWKTFMSYHLVNNVSEYLSDDFVQENFDFYQAKMRGVQEMKPRWKRVVETANFTLGEALGQEYVKLAFSPESKERMIKMVDDLRASMKVRIDGLDWMSADTKAKAQEKLNSFTVKIGYPDKWRDYAKLDIDRGAYVLNVMRSMEFEAQRNFDKIGQPVDKTEWGMTPQTVNAYYNPSNNEIVFPAAILQPPFFDPNADDALNYGGIGAVIGHEITHGFDDQGRQYDANGNLVQWWTDGDDSLFRNKADVVVSQFGNFCPTDGQCINGNLTLGENIADFGGLTIAYYAFKMTEEGKSTEPIDGFTPDQRFFLGFGRIWASSYTDQAMRQQLLTNPHSPGEYRVNGTLANMPEFYQAFGVKPGDDLYKDTPEMAKIW